MIEAIKQHCFFLFPVALEVAYLSKLMGLYFPVCNKLKIVSLYFVLEAHQIL